MRKLLAVFAHPDDEGAIAGTLAHYATQDTEVILICATKGEEGEISDPDLATSDNLDVVRAEELRMACHIIGISQVHFLDYRDSGMAGSASNSKPSALIQAAPEEVTGKIVDLICHHKPDVVITFEPYGWYGHPDHRAISKFATAAYEQVREAAERPDADRSWQPERLFHAVLPASKFQIMAEYAQANHLTDGAFETLDSQKEIEAQITHTLDVHHLLETKKAAMWAHRTQFGEDNWFRKLPNEITQQVWGHEYFIQVYPVAADDLRQQPATDLFGT